MTSKIYVPGSEVTPKELNDIQDDYILTGYEPWMTIGQVGGNAFSSTVAQSQYGYPTSFGDWDSQFMISRLDPADYPNSYNGSLRTRQLRLVVVLQTDTVAIGDRFQDCSLRSVTTSATVNLFNYGAGLGTVSVPSLDEPETSYRFDGDPFTFPSAGQYTIESSLKSQAATVPNVGLAVNILLQTRAV
jgi:hypothetical protein